MIEDVGPSEDAIYDQRYSEAVELYPGVYAARLRFLIGSGRDEPRSVIDRGERSDTAILELPHALKRTVRRYRLLVRRATLLGACRAPRTTG